MNIWIQSGKRENIVQWNLMKFTPGKWKCWIKNVMLANPTYPKITADPGYLKKNSRETI